MAEVYAERGQEVPERLRPKVELPDLTLPESQMLQHYLTVKTDRPVGGFGGLPQIPWSAVHRYAVWNGFVGGLHDWFVQVIQRIDRGVIEDAEAAAEQKKRRPGK